MNALMTLDQSVSYETKESPVLIAAAAFVLAVGGVAAAAVVICGWRGAKQVIMDWARGRVTFVCR